jgi:hypothetical protein
MSEVVQNIDDIRKQHDHKWLLIEAVDVDEDSTTVLTGRLLAHSSDPMEVHRVAMQTHGDLMTIYSEDWPKDLAACFYEA